MEYDTIADLLKATQNGDVDLSIAAISLTPEREKVIDFTHKYYTSNLGILSKEENSWLESIIWVLQRLFFILIGFIAFIYIIGFIMDKLDGDETIKNPHDGAWWALVTFTTTGYGDLVPKTNKGKILASIWMVASLFLLSLFTGYVASALTVQKLSNGPITLSDLYNVDVVVVDGSTAEKRLSYLGIKYKSVQSLPQALELFKNKKVDAIVHDSSMLNYESKNLSDIVITEIENSDEDYGIALPQHSNMIESLNLSILKIMNSKEWISIKSKYNL